MKKSCQVREGKNERGAFIDYTGTSESGKICGQPVSASLDAGDRILDLCVDHLKTNQDRGAEADRLEELSR